MYNQRFEDEEEALYCLRLELTAFLDSMEGIEAQLKRDSLGPDGILRTRANMQRTVYRSHIGIIHNMLKEYAPHDEKKED